MVHELQHTGTMARELAGDGGASAELEHTGTAVQAVLDTGTIGTEKQHTGTLARELERIAPVVSEVQGDVYPLPVDGGGE